MIAVRVGLVAVNGIPILFWSGLLVFLLWCSIQVFKEFRGEGDSNAKAVGKTSKEFGRLIMMAVAGVVIVVVAFSFINWMQSGVGQ